MVEPKKLKVAELREELKNRGLDSKGNKAQLVKRLEKALKQETGELDESHNETLESSVLESSTLETSTEEHDESLVHERQGLSPDKKVTRALVQQKEEERTEVLLQGQEEVDIQEQDEKQEPTSNFQEPMPIEAAEEPQAMDDEEPQPVTKDEPQPVITKVPQPLDTEEPQPLDTDEPQTLDTEEPQPLDTEEPQPMDNEDPLPEKVEQKPEILEEVKEEASIKMAEPEEEYEKQEEPQVVKEEAKREAHPSTLEEEQQQAVLEPKTELNVTEENGDVKNESPVEATDEKTESPVKAAAEEVMEVATEAKESLPEIDSVAEAENQTSEGKDVERDSRKRRRSRSRSRSRERHHRPRHSRSRSPRRQRSRSRDRKRSGSREKRPRSGSREKRHSPDRQRRRDRSRSPRRRVSRFDSPHTKPKDPEENEDWIIATNVQWDRFNCDLHMRISEDGYKCNPITVEGFAFMWAGVRSNYGFTKGKVAFECKILEHLNVNHLPEEETSRHVVRVGYSTDDTSMQLGEEKFSYGYGGTGKASTDCKFTDYGTKFGQGDVISCYLNFEPDNIEISYSKNGEDLGVCYEVEKNELNERALFAHVLTKNCEFDVNFGQKQEPYFPLKEGYAWIGDIAEADRVRGTLPPSKKEDCEIIMMCGLPGAGKTVWATKYFQEHREQRYHVLGTNNIIDKMKVMGLPRKRNYAGRWDILIDKSTKCLNRLLEIASKKKRNYILDQTNVYPSAQRRKMRPFEGFQRRAVVIVPDDEEFKRRCEKREKEEGKEIPDIAVWEMKANFRLPEEGQNFDKVEFIELDRDDASKVVEKYNKEGEENLPPDYLRFRYDNRGSSYGQHGGGGGGGGNRYGGGNRDRRDYGRDRDGGNRGGGRYDRRDNRDRGRGGGWRGNRGGYMGYSSNDRQRYSDKDNRDSNQSYNKDYRSGGRSSYNNYSSGGGGGHSNYSSNKQYNNSSNSSSDNSSWSNQQGSWDNSQQQSGWGNQGSWGNQGWGNQAYSQGWGQQWGNYQQSTQGQQSADTTAQQWQNYYNQYQYPQQSGWGNYSYGYNQQGSTDQSTQQQQPQQQQQPAIQK